MGCVGSAVYNFINGSLKGPKGGKLSYAYSVGKYLVHFFLSYASGHSTDFDFSHYCSQSNNTCIPLKAAVA